MCRAISILKARINLELLEEYNLQSRIRQRGDSGVEEVVFDFADRNQNPQLPVIHDGRMRVYEWGNRGGGVAKLPKTGWCREESLNAGKWRWLSPEQVVRFSITEGIKGIVVQDQSDQPHVYMLTQGASTYYQNMTKHQRMPVLIGEQI